MHRDKFPDDIAITDSRIGDRIGHVLQILGLNAERNKWKNIAVAADNCMGFHNDMGSQAGVGADFSVGGDLAKRADDAVVTDFCAGVDNGQLVNFDHSGFLLP